MAWCWRPTAVMPKSGFFSAVSVAVGLCSCAATETPKAAVRITTVIGERMLLHSIGESDGDWPPSRLERGPIIAQRRLDAIRFELRGTDSPDRHESSLRPCDRPKRSFRCG